MKQENYVIIEGKFLHFTSPKNAKKQIFLLENECLDEVTPVHVIVNEKFTSFFSRNVKRGKTIKVTGRLVKVGNQIYIKSDYIEIKKIVKVVRGAVNGRV